jgi:hypothetical protein
MKSSNLTIQIIIAFIFISAIFAQTPQCNTDDGKCYIPTTAVVFQSKYFLTFYIDCNNGVCKNQTCKCDQGFITLNNENCNYKQKEKLVAFLLSFFIGTFGADWFYLASGSTTYIVAGVIKLLTGIVGIGVPCFLGCAGCLRSDGSKIALFVCIIVFIVLSTTANATWWLADWIRVLVGTFKDGNGQNLRDW